MCCQSLKTRGGHPGLSREVAHSEVGDRHQEVPGSACLGGDTIPSGSEHVSSCKDIGMNVEKQERPNTLEMKAWGCLRSSAELTKVATHGTSD